MWYDSDDELFTPEEQNARYLQQNPELESALWSEWVGVVCSRDKIDLPTAEEWTKLRADFYHGKAPIDSVAELKKMRS
jgi:hypothetical protein